MLALIAAYVAQRTPFGRRVYAVGGNGRAAALSGVRVDRVKIAVYMISGFRGAVAGLIVSSQLVASHPASGETFELNAIAAAVLSGTPLSGGRGRIGGTIIGAFVIGVLADGLVMMGVSEFWQMVIKGVVIIAAVVLDQIQRRLSVAGRGHLSRAVARCQNRCQEAVSLAIEIERARRSSQGPAQRGESSAKFFCNARGAYPTPEARKQTRTH